jgi:hypothetical protein
MWHFGPDFFFGQRLASQVLVKLRLLPHDQKGVEVGWVVAAQPQPAGFE